MMNAVKYLIAIFLLIAFSCSQEKNTGTPSKLSSSDTLPAKSPLFKRIKASQSGIDFNNRITEDEKINLIDYFYLYNGGGVAIGDINNDSLPDIFFTGNQVSSRLYLNKGSTGSVSMQFEDITQQAGVATEGWCSGVTMVDINQDGLLDLYVCRAGNEVPAQRTNLLFVNQGKNANGLPVFIESARKYGLAFDGYSTQSAFFDYDHDGDLDMYLLNHTNEIRTPNIIVPIRKDGSGPANDRLYRNDGSGSQPAFTDVTQKAGILYDGLGLGVGISDLNGDGWEDIYVSNDFLASDCLYLNNRDGTFTNKAGELLKHQSNFAMGNDLADYNNDGWVDIMVVDMLPADNEQRKKMAGPMNYEKFEMTMKMGYQPQYMRNTLQLNNSPNTTGKLTFSEIGQMAGVFSTDWSWAPLWGDFDNDGFKDLLITNGYRRDITDMDFVSYNASLGNNPDQKQADQIIREKAKQMPGLKKPNHLFRNKGDLTFEDVSAAWGLAVPSYSNGAAYGDLDNDGDLDLVINTIDDPALVYENTAADTLKNHYLRVVLKGDNRNKAGLGGDLRLYYGKQMQRYHQAVTRGYQSSVDDVIHVGLGASSKIDSLEITWPDGKVQQIQDVAADQTLQLDYANAGSKKTLSLSKVQQPLMRQPPLQEVTDKLRLHYVHQEDEYNDFAREFLLPHQHSRMGPGIAVGDMNGDGREDFFVSGPFQQAGALFFQTPKGTFRQEPLTTTAVKYEEEMGALLFDADQDGDLDLYVASGGNEFGEDSEYYQDKLYLNNGSGHFQWVPAALPAMRSSTSCVTAADYDRDGDLDLFVGGRLKPTQYPLPGNSYLLRNEQGTFKDVTTEVAPDLTDAGMVTTALWTDFDQDGQVDLITAGEFMPIRFYQNVGGVLKDITQATGLPASNGWWNSLNGADFDYDGDIDYVLGNLGLNSRYHASFEEPVSVYAADFDGNGSMDPILTYYIDGQEYPAASRDDLTRQMVSLRQKFQRYGTYAMARLYDIVPHDVLDQAYVVRANRFESSYLENLGKGRFTLRSLPLAAQVAPVFGILCEDFDQDTHPDILLVGNSYATEVVAGRYDASIGLLLKGDGKGNFQPVSHTQSGFFVDGDAKGLATLLRKDNNPLIIATQNAGGLRVFEEKSVPGKSSFFIKLQPMDAWIELTFADGRQESRELYYVSSYLSQSSRALQLPEQIISVVIRDYAGKSRTVVNSKISEK